MIVLVRPQQSLQKSITYFDRHGITCRGMAVQTIDLSPTLALELQTDITDFKQSPKLQERHLFDTAIVTSRYAADGLATALNVGGCDITEFAKSFIAVGQTTAERLSGIAHDLQITIPTQHNSEGILCLPQLHSVQHQRIAVVKGVSGREVLANQLLSRGASVTEYSIYQRQPLEFDLKVVTDGADALDLLIVTSGEAASILLNSRYSQWLKKQPWLVISERVAKLVKQQGVNSVYISAGASDSALIKCIQEIME